jgi:hypothetical protein
MVPPASARLIREKSCKLEAGRITAANWQDEAGLLGGSGGIVGDFRILPLPRLGD